jgi:hypothetical protein
VYFQLKVTLLHIHKPPVWRRLAVASCATLYQLHHAINDAFEWDDMHLHSFKIGYEGFSTDFDGRPLEGERQGRRYTLESVVYSQGQTFMYTYDFGDDWEHKIVVESLDCNSSIKGLEDSDNPRVAYCLAGRGASPPEDVGGPWGFARLKEAMADPTNPENVETCEHYAENWDIEDWDPKVFDVWDCNLSVNDTLSFHRGSPFSLGDEPDDDDPDDDEDPDDDDPEED